MCVYVVSGRHHYELPCYTFLFAASVKGGDLQLCLPPPQFAPFTQNVNATFKVLSQVDESFTAKLNETLVK